MSSFKRTSSGLNNQHLFHDADMIVYLEGGKTSFSKADVYEDKYNLETEDIIFWQNIFRKFTAGKRLKFKSVGSKTTIKEIAVDIINGNLKTVIVAMDNEFDELLQKRFEHSNVYYTHGYSWENDVWNSNVVKAIIEELTAIKISTGEIENNFKGFLDNIKIAVFADAYMFKKNSSFFPRKNGYLFCVDCAPVDLPKIKKQEIENKLTIAGLKKSTLYSFGRKHSLNPLKFCYGHLLADYCFQLIIHYIKKRHSLNTISKDIIYRMGINKFFQTSFDNGYVYEYYEKQFNAKWYLAIKNTQ